MKEEVAAKKCETITTEGGSSRSNLQDAFKQLPSWGRCCKRMVIDVESPNEKENGNTNVVKSKNDNETREKTRNSDNNDNNITSNVLLSSSSTSTISPFSTESRNQVIHDNLSSTISSIVVPPRQNGFLFEKELHQNDMNNLNRLVIPRNFAETYFPCLQITTDMYKKESLVFFDHQNIAWEMKFEYLEFSQSYVLTRGWKAFVNHYKMRPNFTIRFYQHDQYQDKKHYGIRYPVRVVNKTIRLFGRNCHYICLEDISDDNSINASSSSGGNGQNETDGQGEAEEAAMIEDTGL